MKTKYMSPKMEVVELKAIQPLLTTSSFSTHSDETVPGNGVLSREDEFFE